MNGIAGQQAREQKRQPPPPPEGSLTGVRPCRPGAAGVAVPAAAPVKMGAAWVLLGQGTGKAWASRWAAMEEQVAATLEQLAAVVAYAEKQWLPVQVGPGSNPEFRLLRFRPLYS